MIKAAVFDLDHTLFDRYETQRLCLQGFCDNFNTKENITDKDIIKILEYADMRFTHLGWEYIFDFLVKKDVFKTVPSFDLYCSFLLDKFKYCAVPYNFTKPMLDRLKKDGLSIGLITNGTSEVQRNKLTLLGLNELFDEIIISDEIGFAKPDTKPFEIMADRLKIPPKNMIYAGDSPINDVDPSRKTGYIPVWVMTGKHWVFPEIEVPEFCIKNVSEIPDVIAKLNKENLSENMLW